MANRKSKRLIRPNSVSFWEPSRCDGKIPPFSALILQTKVIYVQNDVIPALIPCISHIQYWTVWNEAEAFDYSRIQFVDTKQGLSSEYQSNFTSMANRKSKPLIRPNSMCFWDLSRCDGKIPPIVAIILQTKFIRTKWCDNSANSMHFTHPILNRFERGSNVRIRTKTYRWNQTRLIERISVELHFYG
jgi:hypothetical protein